MRILASTRHRRQLFLHRAIFTLLDNPHLGRGMQLKLALLRPLLIPI